MASPGDLVATMADALGLPEATLVSHDRALSEAGLRTKGGRGRSAAKVTARDAAHLLTAVLGSAQVKDSVATIKRYAASRPRQTDSSAQGFRGLGIAELAALTGDSSFLDAVEGLITATANGSLHIPAASDQTEAVPTADRTPIIEVMAQTPGTVGAIRIAGIGRGKTASVVYALPDPFIPGGPPPSSKALKAWQTTVEALRADTDLSQQRRVSARTIERLGQLLTQTDKDDR